VAVTGPLEGPIYMATDKLLAWIEPSEDGGFLAAFVAANARRREPAMQLCSSRDEARDWIETQAAALDAPVEWVASRHEVAR